MFFLILVAVTRKTLTNQSNPLITGCSLVTYWHSFEIIILLINNPEFKAGVANMIRENYFHVFKAVIYKKLENEIYCL